MPRDMDLFKKMLLALDSHGVQSRVFDFKTAEFQTYDYEVIRDHVKQLEERGLVSGVHHTSSSVAVMRITSAGHDFIENIRDDDVWSQTKEKAGKAGSVGIGVVVEIAKTIAKDKLQQLLGLKS
jgi:hypothetical protein